MQGFLFFGFLFLVFLLPLGLSACVHFAGRFTAEVLRITAEAAARKHDGQKMVRALSGSPSEIVSPLIYFVSNWLLCRLLSVGLLPEDEAQDVLAELGKLKVAGIK